MSVFDLNFQRETDPQNLLRNLFKQDDLDRYSQSFYPREMGERLIPKVIHQIWLGSPLPSHLARFRSTWQKYHPDWEFKLWTDVELKNERLKCESFIEQSECFGQKSDLARAEVLYRYGGFYIDLDFECCGSLSEIRTRAEFLACLRWVPQAHLGWPSLWPTPLMICNSFFASTPRHPLLEKYLEIVVNGWNDRQRLNLKPSELDRMSLLALGGEEKAARIKETALRTYLPFHQMVSDHLDEVLVLPHTLFQPQLKGWHQIYLMPQFWQHWKKSQSAFPKFWKYSGVKDYSIGHHRSHASWI